MKKFVADSLYIERVNAPFLAGGGSGEDFRAGIERAIALGWRRGRQRRIAGYAHHLARVFAPSFRDETTSPLTSFG